MPTGQLFGSRIIPKNAKPQTEAEKVIFPVVVQ